MEYNRRRKSLILFQIITLLLAVGADNLVDLAQSSRQLLLVSAVLSTDLSQDEGNAIIMLEEVATTVATEIIICMAFDLIHVSRKV